MKPDWACNHLGSAGPNLRVRVQCRQIQVPTPDSKSWHKERPLFNSAGVYSGGRLQRVGLDSRSLPE